MAAAPGYPPEARTVQSASKTGFHLVTPGSNNKFNCDCANNRSLGICSHVVAVAEVNGKLKQFIEWYRKAKKMPSLTKLATSDMPKGRGRKGGRVPRKKQTKTPIATRVDLVDVNSAASENATPESSGVPKLNPIPAARAQQKKLDYFNPKILVILPAMQVTHDLGNFYCFREWLIYPLILVVITTQALVKITIVQHITVTLQWLI